MADGWDDEWAAEPVAAEPPKSVSMPSRGRGRGLLKAKVSGTKPGDSFGDSWETGTTASSNGFSRDGGGHAYNNYNKRNDESREYRNSSDQTCRKCDQPGHFARNCPEGGFGGGGSRTCHKCNEEGHIARDCPNAGNDTRTCRKCNQPGHIARECPEGDSGGGFGGGGNQTCRRCNEEGHIARDCPQADTRTCHKCNQPGHLARDCTEEPSGDGPSGDGPGPSTYIPQDYNDEDDLIVKAGINFDNYDRIDVEVTGRNKPKFITSFKEANLHPQLLDNIPREFTKPTPVQKYAIPIVQAGRDLMACSMTGSGKTAAFLLPIIDYLLKEDESPPLSNSITVFPRALIVGPTRELVLQTYQWSEKFTKNTEINGRKLYGKLQTGYLKNHIRSGGGTHILSATPGRLKDFLEKGWISFNFLKYVVLDEADRMLDMGFAPDIEEIFSRMTSSDPKQVLMFSATFPKEVQQMASKYCQDYLFLAVGIVGAACADVEQQIILVESPDDDGDIKNKDDCLRDILISVRDKSGRMTKKVLVFVEQKKKADCLGMELCELGFSATTIHGDREQPEREEALRTFKKGKHMLLVATSVAARGLDIPEVDYVVNYNIPSDIDSYVHRIGRTGRCGNKGKAISFYDPSSDSGLANFLVDQLQKAGQHVPAFLQKDVGYAGTGTRPGQSRDIRRNVPRSRHNFGQGGHDQNFDDESDNFMSGGKNYETEPSWGNGGGEVAQDNDDAW